jgi:hypothetical protein
LEDCHKRSCWKNPIGTGTVQVGRVRVFEEFLTVLNCSVLTFWSAIKFLREENPEYIAICIYIYIYIYIYTHTSIICFTWFNETIIGIIK